MFPRVEAAEGVALAVAVEEHVVADLGEGLGGGELIVGVDTPLEVEGVGGVDVGFAAGGGGGLRRGGYGWWWCCRRRRCFDWLLLGFGMGRGRFRCRGAGLRFDVVGWRWRSGRLRGRGGDVWGADLGPHGAVIDGLGVDRGLCRGGINSHIADMVIWSRTIPNSFSGARV